MAFATAVSALCSGGGAAASGSAWTLVWSDEFNGANGSAPDSTKWTYDIGGNGWGNRELEYYTSRPQNVEVRNGNLVITATRETYTGADGITRNYTSARVKTQGLFSQQYGKFEARIKLPYGQGIWPAFWLLGSNISSLGWPACGEIDIMENIGREPSKIHGSLHGPQGSGQASLSGAYTLPSGQKFSDDYHVFAVEWEPNEVRFYVDGTLYESHTAADMPAGSWVFDHPFYIILNVAVGRIFLFVIGRSFSRTAWGEGSYRFSHL
jgi:beta-glucanase (GH16 family)